MADQFIGEIRIFPSMTFLPAGWVWCDGQLLSSTTYAALYAIIGSTYGGNSANFAVPDLRGRAPMHPGQGPGLSLHDLAEAGGAETVTLLAAEMPSHSHNAVATSTTGDTATPGSTVILAAAASGSTYRGSGTLAAMGDIVTSTGGDQPHNNLQPYLTFQFAIAYRGINPPQT